jgi:hypothetical protein
LLKRLRPARPPANVIPSSPVPHRTKRLLDSPANTLKRICAPPQCRGGSRRTPAQPPRDEPTVRPATNGSCGRFHFAFSARQLERAQRSRATAFDDGYQGLVAPGWIGAPHCICRPLSTIPCSRRGTARAGSRVNAGCRVFPARTSGAPRCLAACHCDSTHVCCRIGRFDDCRGQSTASP